MKRASGGDWIPAEIFEILRWSCESAALNMPENLENSAAATDRKKSVFIPITKKGNAK